MDKMGFKVSSCVFFFFNGIVKMRTAIQNIYKKTV